MFLDSLLWHASILNIYCKQGISNPTKDARRRFNRVIDALVSEGILEKIGVTTPDRNKLTPCVRLVDVKFDPEEAENSRTGTAGPWEGEEVDEPHPFVPAFKMPDSLVFELLTKSGEVGMLTKVRNVCRIQSSIVDRRTRFCRSFTKRLGA